MCKKENTLAHDTFYAKWCETETRETQKQLKIEKKSTTTTIKSWKKSMSQYSFMNCFNRIISDVSAKLVSLLLDG